ncbi:MAG: protein kinase, partial [Acidobacteriota bacterium]|nr:protein kinase [Acidobacteriota bacterium]
MHPERWQQIDQLFHSVLEQEPNRRGGFLAQECMGDESLRSQVEALISSHEESSSFVEPLIADVAAGLLAEGHARLAPGTTVGHYEILALLGEGGMGQVFLAEDTRLHRRIALKLLPARFTLDPDRVRRFEQEACAASALNHPNILTIHEIGRLDGTDFIVTEFIDGQTLRAEMTRKKVKLTEALDMVIQVTSALEAAHTAGIVHRDIKPENIMLRRDGYVKILDFGLAKLSEMEPETAPRGLAESKPGSVMGTVTYMSPEQARGLVVDARTDIWSLGVVLYEIVTRRKPFEGATATDVILSIVEKDSLPLTHHAPEVPAELERIVNKALRKNSEERYQTVNDLGLDLKRLKEEMEAEARLERSVLPASSRNAATNGTGQPALETVNESAGATADVPAHPTSTVEYVASETKSHKQAVLAVAAVIISVAALSYFFYFAKGGDAIDSVAVLPFVNLDADPNKDYLSEGISDSIINSLSHLPKLRVMSLSAVLPYKGQQMDPRVIGRELNVRAVLIGRLKQQGDGLVISTELVDVRDNRRLWGEQYERKLADIQGVQKEISRDISENLRLRLTGDDRRQLAKPYTANSEAYQLYLLGQYHLRKLSKEGLAKALEYFEQAIDKDPGYAPAYVGVAVTYHRFGVLGMMHPKEAQQKAESATLKALQLDDNLAEAHVSLGYIKKRNWDWAAAEKEYRRALELNPGSAEANGKYSNYLRDVGRPDEALAYAKRTYEIEGLSPNSLADLAEAYSNARQYDQAIELYLKAIEMDPNFAPAYARLGGTYLAKGMYKEAIEALQKVKALENSPERQGRFAWLACAYAASGKRDEAQKMLDELKGIAKQRYIPPYIFALIYAGLGDKDQAFAWLDKAYEEHSQNLAQLK